MTTKERLLQEIEQLDDAELEALFTLVRQFLAQLPADEEGNLLERLSSIQIDGPIDFSENLDQYLTGEKAIDPSLH